MFGFQLPDDGFDANEIERFQETGGTLPAGRYHLILDGVRSDRSAKKGTPFQELTFKVASGKFAGMELVDQLYESDKKAAQEREMLLALKLGGLKRNGAKLVYADGVEGFSDLIGKEIVADVEHEAWESKDEKTGAMKKGVRVRLSFRGIYATTDPAAKGIVGKVTVDHAERATAKKKEAVGL